MRARFPTDNEFYLVCHNAQTPFSFVMKKAGFSENERVFDNYDLPCISLYRNKGEEHTDTLNVLNSMKKLLPLTRIILFETVVNYYSFDELYQSKNELIEYVKCGLLDTIIMFKGDGGGSKDMLDKLYNNQNHFNFSSMDTNDFLKSLSSDTKIFEKEDVLFELKLTVPFDFKTCLLYNDKKFMSMDILDGFKMNCLGKNFR
ncbi:hypothetical protein [Photobacterium damselae]|uniref:hypothetical protein n=1 Tax=Photobacterium damselae TaxID=38293 RepID=UPI0040698A3D